MICNIVDNRRRRYRWRRIDAIIEATAHDNGCADSDRQAESDEDVTYAQRKGISLAEAVQWASALASSRLIAADREGFGSGWRSIQALSFASSSAGMRTPVIGVRPVGRRLMAAAQHKLSRREVRAGVCATLPLARRPGLDPGSTLPDGEKDRWIPDQVRNDEEERRGEKWAKALARFARAEAGVEAAGRGTTTMSTTARSGGSIRRWRGCYGPRRRTTRRWRDSST